ncbi:MAG TPA: hypothetical protein VLK84_18005 [Longimicrobium sp.]|nr:hypothetical protein [Longimicrobium sp.]
MLLKYDRITYPVGTDAFLQTVDTLVASSGRFPTDEVASVGPLSQAAIVSNMATSAAEILLF